MTFVFFYLMTKVPEVPVSAVNRFLCHGDRNVMLLRVLNSVFSALDFPFSPRCHNFKFRVQRKEGELKPNLVNRSKEEEKKVM